MSTINVMKLHAELEKAGIPIEGVSSSGRIDFLPAATDEQKVQAEAILAAHDPNTLLKVDQVQADAKGQATAIPNWAIWTEQQAVDWISANVTDLASARQVLLAMVRMLVALRNQTWPDLQA
jgi:hypothetical protein